MKFPEEAMEDKSDLMRIRTILAGKDSAGPIRNLLVDLLDGIGSGTRNFRAVYHPLGFVYVPLIREKDWSLRLHLWLAEETRMTTTFSPYQVHMHTWDLSSYVLHGSLQNQMIDAGQDQDGPQFRVFDIVGHGNESVISPTADVVRASVASTHSVHAGEIYRIPHSRYHTTLNPTGKDMITVALVERVPGTTERALGPLDGNRHTVTRRLCPAKDLAARASKAREVLA
jgi:hypothetical protein